MQICDLVNSPATTDTSFFELGQDSKLKLYGEEYPKFPGIVIFEIG